VNISSGGLEIGGTQVISSSRAISGTTLGLTGTLTSNLAASSIHQEYQRAGSKRGDIFISSVDYALRPVAGVTLTFGTSGVDSDIKMFSNIGQAWLLDGATGNITMTGTLGLTGTRVSQGFFTNITSTNAVVVDSDSTLKQNITPITNATETILAINPVEYTWKSDSLNKVHYGVIAQEINEILPNIVISNGETLGVAYGEIIPYLLAAIKELEARITELEGN
jgi:hypothetical protein